MADSSYMPQVPNVQPTVGYGAPYSLPEKEEREEEERVTRSGGGSVTKLTDEGKAQLAEESRFAEREAEATQQVRDQQQARADLEAEQAKEAEKIEQQKAAERAAAIEETKASIDTWRNKMQSERERLMKTPAPALGADRAGGEKLLLGLGIALSAFTSASARASAIRAGIRPDSSDPVGDIIEADLSRQRTHIEKLNDNVIKAKTGLEDAQEGRRMLLSLADMRAADALGKLGATGKKRLAMLGQAQPAIDQNEALLKIEAKRLELQRRSVEPLRETIEKAQTTVRSGTTTIDRQGGARSGGAAAANIGTNVIFGADGAPVVNAPGTAQAQHVTPKQAQETNNKLAAYRNLRDALAGLKADIEQNGAVLPYTPKGEARKTKAGAITGLLKEAEDLGALDAGVDKLVNKVIGSPAALLTGRLGAGEKIAEAINLQDGKAANSLEQLGIRGATGILPLINGTAKPTARPPEQAAPATSIPPVGAKDSPEDVNSDKPLPEDPGAEELPEAKKTGERAPTPSAAAPQSPREKAVAFIKRNPSSPIVKELKKRHGISDEELR